MDFENAYKANHLVEIIRTNEAAEKSLTNHKLSFGYYPSEREFFYNWKLYDQD